MDFIILFFAVFFINTLPAFAPPTWVALSYSGVRYPLHSVTLVALVAATAATLGRFVLAKMARLVVRQKFLSAPTRENIDVLKDVLEKRQKLTFGVCLFYSFSPIPSNYLFIAYGLTSLRWILLIVPYFIGRLCGYSLFIFTSSITARKLVLENPDHGPYMSAAFVISQCLLLGLLYLFTKLDWRALFTDKKFRLLKSKTAQSINDLRQAEHSELSSKRIYPSGQEP